MSISKYLKNILRNFFISSGCLITITTIISWMYGLERIEISQVGQILFMSLAYAFLKLAFVSEDELGKRGQLIYFNVNLSIAEVILLSWLLFFSPGKIMDINLLILYIVVIGAAKILVYKMMRINGEKNAKLINLKLIENRNIQR